MMTSAKTQPYSASTAVHLGPPVLSPSASKASSNAAMPPASCTMPAVM